MAAIHAESGSSLSAFVVAPPQPSQSTLHSHALRGTGPSAGVETAQGGWSVPAVGAVVAAAATLAGSRRKRGGRKIGDSRATEYKPPLDRARVIVCAGSKLPEGRKLRVAVVGGGPGGASCADTLARAGIETYLIERKMDNCKPCGGAIPLCMIDEFDLPPNIVDRQVRKMTMISPTNKEVQIGQTLKDNEFIGMLRREVLDSFLRNRAAENGANVINGLFLGMTLPKGKEDPYVLTYNDFSDQDGNARQGTKKTLEVDVVIGGDGANSRVAKDIKAGDYEYAIAFQERMKVDEEKMEYYKERAEMYVGEDFGSSPARASRSAARDFAPGLSSSSSRVRSPAMAFIRMLKAREILDSRGNPTIEVDLATDKGLFRAAVPSGASTGIYEALELRDKDMARYNGKGVLTAVKNVNELIAPKLFGKNVLEQGELDKMMYEELDGSQNEWGWSKEKLGANAILAVSMAICRAAAACKNQPLYQRIAELAGKPTEKFVLPVPAFNVINGGSHAGNGLPCQEFMVLPTGASNFREALQIGAEVYHALKKVITERYGQDATNVGDEGGFAPNVTESDEALEVLMMAIEKSGHKAKVKIGTDIAASEFYDADSKKYDLYWKDKAKKGTSLMTTEELGAYFKTWTEKYPLVSIEDPFDQDDWDGYRPFTASIGAEVQVVGDDLLVTNPKRIAKALEGDAACNALLLKVNQIGSVSEAVEACKMCQEKGWGVMVSHRSGETEDIFIADLSVGLRAGQIKTGAPCRSERNAKYNQLLRIEEELGDRAVYAGVNFRKPVA